MQKNKRREDIGNRLSLAMAERSLYDRNDRHYAQLTEVIRAIRNEYTVNWKRGNNIRHGFRVRGTDYHMVILSDDERI